MLLEAYVITYLKTYMHIYFNSHQILPCAEKHMAWGEKKLVHGLFDLHASNILPPQHEDLQ